ncbi:hypothetical protein SIO17_14650 [Pseudoalteromonas piscicida]|uniref:Glycosyltransferase subfamily 4-like N-terminal domain-containing protein n=1 Tax=Pseudoalteromonas piscicida TaxID=43662 RepID=A0ABM6NH82_PSEO7|nr:hypothetical protein [Pseudoalteromonas piscicida]ATD08297.1 hypothetical protein PPIS_a3521 [Pseudoalteromonas piscicida]WPU30347.1 hypothetical protein SIO17_14650 [Pseudoalteromonas piscicida]
MKVLHIEAGRHLYGGAQQVVYLTQALQQKGIENVLVCPPNSEMIAAVDKQVVVEPVKMAGDLDVMQWFGQAAIAKHNGALHKTTLQVLYQLKQAQRPVHSTRLHPMVIR